MSSTASNAGYRFAILTISALSALACAPADFSCDIDSNSVSASFAGQNSLPAGASFTRQLELNLTGFSPLGTSEVFDSYLRLHPRIFYGADLPDNAELPRVDAELTALFPDGTRRTIESGPTLLFECSATKGDDPTCCLKGDNSCTAHLEVAFSRGDQLFPEVQVEWILDVSVEVVDCRENDLRLTLMETSK